MASAEDIARLWAEQAEKGPRVAGNFWRGKKYPREAGHHRSCTARIVDGKEGTSVALIWNNGGGTGTAMFLNLCEGKARKAGLQTFRVPHIDGTSEGHAKNLAWFEARAVDCEARIVTARSRDWQADADRFRATAAEYRAAFNL